MGLGLEEHEPLDLSGAVVREVAPVPAPISTTTPAALLSSWARCWPRTRRSAGAVSGSYTAANSRPGSPPNRSRSSSAAVIDSSVGALTRVLVGRWARGAG